MTKSAIPLSLNDAYGRIIDISGSLKDTIGEENPFRYRSYFFDEESGYYYLQSRYYDPMMGRFISADSQINPDVNGGNVFAYCISNPVMRIDRTGHKSLWNSINKTWSDLKKWMTSTPKSTYTIPSTNEIAANLSGAFLGGTQYTISKQKRISKYELRNGYIEPRPSGGVPTSAYPKFTNGLDKITKGLTVVTSGLDIANTWTDNNDNTNGDRLLKSSIQVGGVIASAGVGYMAIAAANCWNPVGIGMLGAALTFGAISFIGAEIISIGQNKLYDELGLE